MLANMLAVYTHSDAARMESLLSQTKLVSDKWHEQRGKLTWIEYQVQDAIHFEASRQEQTVKKAEGKQSGEANNRRQNRVKRPSKEQTPPAPAPETSPASKAGKRPASERPMARRRRQTTER